MRKTFIHRFRDGRAASQIFEVDFEAPTYRFVRWEFSHPDAGHRLRVGECKVWFSEVTRHFAELGFKAL
jgi:hypothetical protein